MAREGPSKRAQPGAWQGRLDNARAFHEAARDLLELRDMDANANPVVSEIVNAAIAYADALSARFGGVINQQDHQAAVQTPRRALRSRADAKQLGRLSQILQQKDAAQYGVRRGRMDHARQLIEQLERLASWVETELARP